jgi:hypothetical protein
MVRWVWALVVAGVYGALVGCSGSSGVGDAQGGTGGTGATSSGGVGASFGFGGNGTCTPRSCSDQGVDCGTVPNGCGELIECGGCDGDDVCGATSPNVCGEPGGLCQPIARDLACDGKECGLEGDGCGGTHDCGSCPEGQSCGVEEAFQCGLGGTGDPNDCPSLIESCASVGVNCGMIGNGCGGIIDCNAETGGCPSGTYCGIVSPSQCDAPPPCVPAATSCAELGWECGIAVNNCGNQYSCAVEGRGCGALEICVGGIGSPTVCTSTTADCPLCQHVPDCSGQSQSTRIEGRVVTPGRDDDNVGNQVGVPNAFVYILRSNDLGTLPAITEGLPSDPSEQRCDRCEDDVLGPVLTGAVSDSKGEYVLEGNIPVNVDFLLVVKVGKFRRAVPFRVESEGACETTNLPVTVADGNPTRLARHLDDGFGVNIPRVAIGTGDYDAMECVLEKIGIDHELFTPPTQDGRIHLYRDNGAWPNQRTRRCIDCAACSGTGSSFRSCVRNACDGCTLTQCPNSGGTATCQTCQGEAVAVCQAEDYPTTTAPLSIARLYESSGRIGEYDMVISDCRGNASGGPTAGSGNAGRVRQYLNRGGRFFASHFSHNWLQHGDAVYDPSAPIATGLNDAVTWTPHTTGLENGTGIIAQNPPRERASLRIDTFIDWMLNENATTLVGSDYTFNIPEPRSRATALGEYTEEFVHCDGGTGCMSEGDKRPQQLAFNTPYAPPEEGAACGRVVYTGFHVSVIGTGNQNFPAMCTGDLSPTEKSLVYLFFDLGACVGEEPQPPSCTPTGCGPEQCGTQADGCGGAIDCGPCIPTCAPLTCDAQGAECGAIGDGCGEIVQCGACPPGQVCGAQAANQCGTGTCTPIGCPQGAQCGQTGDGCGGIVSCGVCPSGQVCGILEAFRCDTAPGCDPITCSSVGAQCGVISDGCGGVSECGECPSGQVCGLNQANRCGSIR